MEYENAQEKCEKLKKLYDESEGKIKTEAMVRYAFINKTSQETVNDKVNAQMNSIMVGIHEINPKFKEGSKNYDATKKRVTEILAEYEQTLIELSEFYDGKIEQLILRKVELEANLVGCILNEEYLKQRIIKKNKQKDNDLVKRSVKDNIKIAIEKIKNQRENNQKIDPMDISKLLDQQDVVIELDQKLSDRIEKSVKDEKDNKDFIKKIEKEISMINSEIDRINGRKKDSIYEAMEVGSRAITTNIRRPRVFNKITRFFVSRFNTAKIIETTIIKPLVIRIENFRNNELAGMKG